MLNKTSAVALLLTFGFSCGASESSAKTIEKFTPNPAILDQDGKVDEQKAMAEMMRLGTPGDPHKNLAKLVGEWEYTMTFRMGRDAEWMESKGTSSYKSALGGRFIIQTVKGDAMGMPFEGMMLQGYDNLTERYFIIWMDNMSTGYSISHGQKDEAGVLTAKGLMRDVRSPDGRPYKSVATPKADGSMLFEMFETGPDGTEMKTMDITYTRN